MKLLNEMLLKRSLNYRKSLDELSEWELEEILYELVHIKERNKESTILIKKVLNKLYTKEAIEFYLEIIDYIHGEKDGIELINKYANGEYSNEIFCRTCIKPFWYIESKILIKRGYPRVRNVLSQMLLWFQDLNWPGASEIWELLSLVDKEVMIPHLEEATMTAKEEKDESWLYFLGEFIINNGYKKEDFKNKDIYELLKKSTDI